MTPQEAQLLELKKALDLLPVEKGVPIPRRKNRKYPWQEMEKGDSFLVPCAISEIKHMESSVTSCRHHAQKVTGFKFVIRRTNRGIRVWRVL